MEGIHYEEKGRIKDNNKRLYYFFIAFLMNFNNEWINNAIYIISYIIVGLEIVRKAIRNIIRGKVFDENFF